MYIYNERKGQIVSYERLKNSKLQGLNLASYTYE